MSLSKLKQVVVSLMAVGVLTACGSNTDKIIETIATQVQTDEAVVVQLQETMTQQADFMEAFEDLLKDAAKKYEKVEDVLADMKTEAGALKAAFETAQSSLVLTEDDEEKLSKLLAKSEKEEGYETVSTLVSAYQAYKTNLEKLSADNVELMTTYESFLGEMSGDMPFQTLENLIGSLNESLTKVQTTYEAYTEAATQFQTLLMQTQN